MGFNYAWIGGSMWLLVIAFVVSLIFFFPWSGMFVKILTSFVIKIVVAILDLIFGLFGKKNKFKMNTIKGGFK